MNRILPILIFGLLAGCLHPEAEPVTVSPPSDATDTLITTDTISAVVDLGFLVRVQAPFTYYSMPGTDCSLARFQIPPGTTQLAVTLTYDTVRMNGTGLLGFGARNQAREVWVDSPNVIDPSEEADWLVSPRSISFENPPSGPWETYLFTVGPSYNQNATISIVASGAFPQPPSLEVVRHCV